MRFGPGCRVIPHDSNVTLPGNKGNEILAMMDQVSEAGFSSPQVDCHSLFNKRKPFAAWKVGNQS